MTDLRKAAEIALERLESHEYWMDEEAIQALRQALAQPEQEPVKCMCGICKLGKHECNECELLREAIKKAYLDGVNNGIKAVTVRNIT